MKELKKNRSAVDMISVSFEFFRQNYIPILKNVFLYVSPLMIISHYILFRMGGDSFGRFLLGGTVAHSFQQNGLPVSGYIQWLVVSVFLVLGWLLLYFIVNEHVSRSVNTPGSKLSALLQSGLLKQRLPDYAGVMLVYLLALTILIMLVIVIPSGFISFLVILFILFLMVQYSLAFPALCVENKGILQSFQRSYDLIKNSWWRSFWYYFFVFWTTYFIGMALIAPFLLSVQALTYLNISFPQTVTASWIFLIVFFIYYLFTLLILSAFFVLSVTVNYFSLVDKHDETYLEEKIHEIDTE